MRNVIDKIGRGVLFAAAVPFIVYEEARAIAAHGRELDAHKAAASRSEGERDEARHRLRLLEHAVAARDDSLRLLRHESEAEIARLRGTVEALGERAANAEEQATRTRAHCAQTESSMRAAVKDRDSMAMELASEPLERAKALTRAGGLNAAVSKMREERDAARLEAATIDEILIHARASCDDLEGQLKRERLWREAADKRVFELGSQVKGLLKRLAVHPAQVSAERAPIVDETPDERVARDAAAGHDAPEAGHSADPEVSRPSP